MTRTSRAFLISMALLATFVAPTMASTTAPFVGVFRETFGGGNAPSGIGMVVGIGHGTETFSPISVTPDGSCSLEPGNTVLGFADGEIHLREDNRLCTPGESGAAPGSQVSYGNPVLWTGTYTITGGTGDYVGATGNGTTSGQLAGDIIVIRYNGSITLP